MAAVWILYLLAALSPPSTFFHTGRPEAAQLCIASTVALAAVLIVRRLKMHAEMRDVAVQERDDVTRQARENEVRLHTVSAQLKFETDRGWVRERALQKSERAYRAIFEQTAVGIVQIDLDGRVVLANPHFCDLMGYSLDELPYLDLQTLIHPKDAPASREWMAELLHGAIAAVTRDLRCIRKDESVAWINLNAFFMRDPTTGKPECFLCFLRDISGRKRAELALQASEEKYRVTVEQCPVGIVQVGLDGKCLHANSGLLELLGYSLAELREMTFARFTHPADLDAQLEWIEALLAGEMGSFSMDKRYIRKVASSSGPV